MYCSKKHTALTALSLFMLFSSTPTKSLDPVVAVTIIGALYLGYSIGKSDAESHAKKKELARLKDRAEQLVSTIKTISDKATQIEQLEQQRTKLKACKRKHDKQSDSKNDCTDHDPEPTTPEQTVLEAEEKEQL